MCYFLINFQSQFNGKMTPSNYINGIQTFSMMFWLLNQFLTGAALAIVSGLGKRIETQNFPEAPASRHALSVWHLAKSLHTTDMIPEHASNTYVLVFVACAGWYVKPFNIQVIFCLTYRICRLTGLLFLYFLLNTKNI